MARSLKQKNQPQVITFVLSNAIALGVIALGQAHLVNLLQQFTKGDWRVISKLVALPAFLTLVTAIVGWAMPRTGKELFVFWRTRNCLPSSRAFSVIGLSDPRIDMQRIVSRYGPIPEKPNEQTALWYRIYRGHKDDVSVQDAHGAYLKFREMATLSIALIILSGCLAAYIGIGRQQLFLGAGLLIVEYLIVVSAARNAATRLVSNVLAIESADPFGIGQ